MCCGAKILSVSTICRIYKAIAPKPTDYASLRAGALEKSVIAKRNRLVPSTHVSSQRIDWAAELRGFLFADFVRLECIVLTYARKWGWYIDLAQPAV